MGRGPVDRGRLVAMELDGKEGKVHKKWTEVATKELTKQSRLVIVLRCHCNVPDAGFEWGTRRAKVSLCMAGSAGASAQHGAQVIELHCAIVNIFGAPKIWFCNVYLAASSATSHAMQVTASLLFSVLHCFAAPVPVLSSSRELGLFVL
jgi:hypothetical protein